MSNPKMIRIGGASGYWGESDMALPQFLQSGDLDYIVFDYLAEITMSILARARAKSPELGYATDFVSSVLKPNLHEIAEQKVKIISNAGGVNPAACGRAIRKLIQEAGLKLRVAVIEGDDLLDRVDQLSAAGNVEMFSGDAFPPAEKVASINAYLGAFPIAEALRSGADIVITGRCVDSAVTLGACIHAFGWGAGDCDLLAMGSLAGHILECGPQATGGNFTDWHLVADSLYNIGYPIAEIGVNGSVEITKAANTGGMVSVGTVGEQMLYEIGDPQTYILPDVVCDFSNVSITQVGENRVCMTGASGRMPPSTYKVCSTLFDGYRAGTVSFFYGEDAGDKARLFANSVLIRAREKLRSKNLAEYSEVSIEIVGEEAEYGSYCQEESSRSVALKIAAKHEDQKALSILLRELTGHGLAAPPGLSGFAGARAKPTPVLKLFSFEIPKNEIGISIDVEGVKAAFELESHPSGSLVETASQLKPTVPADSDLKEVPLIKLAWARSGDKGNKANIGVLPRRIEYAPYLWAALTETVVAKRFQHFLEGNVSRYYLPGTGAINFLLDRVLGGGGVASLRNDPQGKGYSQILLQTPIAIPRSIAEEIV